MLGAGSLTKNPWFLGVGTILLNGHSINMPLKSVPVYSLIV